MSDLWSQFAALDNLTRASLAQQADTLKDLGSGVRYDKVDDDDAEIARLQREIAEMRKRMAATEAALSDDDLFSSANTQYHDYDEDEEEAYLLRQKAEVERELAAVRAGVSPASPPRSAPVAAAPATNYEDEETEFLKNEIAKLRSQISNLDALSDDDEDPNEVAMFASAPLTKAPVSPATRNLREEARELILALTAAKTAAIEKNQAQFVQALKSVKEHSAYITDLAGPLRIPEILEALKKKTAQVLQAASGLFKNTDPMRKHDFTYEIDEAMKGVGQAIKLIVNPQARELLEEKKRRDSASSASQKAAMARPVSAAPSSSSSSSNNNSNNSSSQSTQRTASHTTASSQPMTRQGSAPINIQGSPTQTPRSGTPTPLATSPSTSTPSNSSDDHHLNTTLSCNYAELPVFKCGWLSKQGGGTKTLGRKSWQKRWFILTANRLIYYTNQTLQVQKGEIPLHDCRSCEKSPDKKNPFRFQLETATRTFFIVADNEKEMNEWVHAVRCLGRILTLDEEIRGGKILEQPYKKDLVRLANTYTRFCSQVVEKAQAILKATPEGDFKNKFSPLVQNLGDLSLQLLNDCLGEYISGDNQKTVQVSTDAFYVKQIMSKLMQVSADHSKTGAQPKLDQGFLFSLTGVVTALDKVSNHVTAKAKQS